MIFDERNTMPSCTAEVTSLAAKLMRAKQAYYFSGLPLMSDAEYDALEDALASIAPDHPILATVGAPLPPDSHQTRVTHKMPMGSQAKVHATDEFLKWAASRGEGALHVSLKADGNSVAAYYMGGVLKRAVTRGDGVEGEDITSLALCFKGLPGCIPEMGDVSVRFEAVLTESDWRLADPQMSSNPRNMAAGILGRKDGSESPLISAIAFDIDGVDASTEEEKCHILAGLGFSVVDWRVCSTTAEVSAFRDEIAAARNNLPYRIDGLVVKINDVAYQKKFGEVSGRPKGQVAWKFEPEGADSVVLGVEWQVGHTGAITPVATIEPVRIGGTTVRAASLANADVIEELGVAIGSRIKVVKAGDIIPKIVYSYGGDGLPPIVAPEKCPCCSGKVGRKKNVDGSETIALFCENDDCEAKTTGRIRRWAKSRDILGLGGAVIESLCSSGLVSTVADLFELTPERIEAIEINKEKGIRLGRLRADAICSEIKAKGHEMSLAEFLGGFGTRSLGVRRATLMIEANPALADFEKWFDGSLENETFAAKAGVPRAGRIIYDGLKDQEESIRRALKSVNLVSAKADAPRVEGGKVFCITGSLPSGRKKKDYSVPLASCGHRLVDDLTAEVDYLVVADPLDEPSSKMKKASKLGIPMIGEADLIKWTTPRSLEAPLTPTAISPRLPATQKMQQGMLF